MMKSIMVIGAVVLLSPPVAMARSVGVCAADIRAKCAEVKPGGGRIKDCVKTHAAEFSDACKARLARVAEISKACTTDVKESCPGKEGAAQRQDAHPASRTRSPSVQTTYVHTLSAFLREISVSGQTQTSAHPSARSASPHLARHV